MSGTNSKFKYMYRDASNYKQFGYAIFSAEFTPQDIERVIGNLHEGDFFIPEDVGLPSLQEKFGNVSLDDHPWHEINFRGEIERSPFELRVIVKSGVWGFKRRPCLVDLLPVHRL